MAQRSTTRAKGQQAGLVRDRQEAESTMTSQLVNQDKITVNVSCDKPTSPSRRTRWLPRHQVVRAIVVALSHIRPAKTSQVNGIDNESHEWTTEGLLVGERNQHHALGGPQSRTTTSEDYIDLTDDRATQARLHARLVRQGSQGGRHQLDRPKKRTLSNFCLGAV